VSTPAVRIFDDIRLLVLTGLLLGASPDAARADDLTCRTDGHRTRCDDGRTFRHDGSRIVDDEGNVWRRRDNGDGDP
jgi:hypothetical protein